MATKINEENGKNDIQQKLDSAYDYEATGKPDEALKLCAEVIETDPDLAEVHNLQGIVLEQLGRKQEAVESYEKAVKLDPNFEEANENLAGLKAEIEPNLVEEDTIIYAEDRDAYKEDAIYVAKWGALAFGLTFGVLALANVMLTFINLYILNPQYMSGINNFGSGMNQYWLRDLLEYMLPILLVGMATAVLGSISHNKPLVFGLVGGFGFAFSRWLVLDILIYEFLTRTNFFVPFWLPSFFYMLMGAIYGAFIGMITKEIKQIGWLALAGAIGVGICGWNFGIHDSALFLNSGFYSTDILNMDTTQYFVNSSPVVITNLITGAILGALIGGVLGWFAGEELVEEDSLIEKPAFIN